MDNKAAAAVATPKPVSADARAAAKSSNQLGLDLYQRLSEGPGNRLFSPAGVASALALLSGAASGETRAEMERVLQSMLPEGRLHAAYGELVKDLNSQKNGCTLHLLNRLWLQEGSPIEPEFLAMVRRDYESEVGTLDFAQPDAAREAINQWASKATAGRIGALMPPGVLREETRFVVAGAIDFKGTWTYQFAPADTHDAPFSTTKEQTIAVPTMHSTGNQLYAETPETQMLKLPYVGGQFAMLIVLPRQVDGLAALEQQLTAEKLADWTAALSNADTIEVHLPKFTFTSGSTLKNALAAMGMSRAFSDEAEFARLTREHAQRLDDFLMESYIDVNEEGTEAAASWGGAFGNAPGPVPMTHVFNADHPFLFLIQDERSGLILFLGRVSDPRGN